MAAAAILDFQKFEILTIGLLWWSNVHHLAKFHQNRSNGCRYMAIYWIFQNGGRPPCWIFWDHPWWPIGGFYRCAKFGWNRCSSFDNMKHSKFCLFGLMLTMPIHDPKIGVSGDFTPKMGSKINETPERHTIAHVHIVWAIKRENCWWVWPAGEFLETKK